MNIQYEKNTVPVRAPAAVLLRRLILAWLLAAGVEFMLTPGDLASLDTVANLSAPRMLVMGGIFLAALYAVPQKFVAGERWGMVFAAALMAGSLMTSFTPAYFIACLLILLIVVVYALAGWAYVPSGPLTRPGEDRRFAWIAAVIGAAFFAFVSVWTVCRVLSFCAPTYDFTIFAQMFYSMKETGLPITTVERDGPLSHFAVHVSPIYYLLLPFYCLAPDPATLQVLQAAVLASALISLWKLGRHHGLKPWQRCALCLVLALYPAYSGGTSYDIHENAFLTPLILWLLYGLDRRSVPITAVSALLTCMVKEDAAVYVAVIALWQILRGILRKDEKWNLLAGAALMAGSVAWFLAVTGYLAQSGDGVMTYRYKNFMFDGSDSLFTVIRAVLLCPMKAVYECVDPEKLEFIGLTLLPLLGLPLLTRRYERYILLIPYILVNLMSDYQYQHDIFFQYTFGSTACLMYLTVVNLAELKLDRRITLGGMAAIAALMFALNVVPKASLYPQYCVRYAETYEQRRALLAQIPDDASAAATTFFTAPLANRETLYDIRYGSREHILECEYVVISLSDTASFKKYATTEDNGREKFIEFLTENGYAWYAELENQVVIYKR